MSNINAGQKLSDLPMPRTPFTPSANIMRYLLLIVFLCPAFVAQTPDSPREKEEPIQKTLPDKKLAKEDVQCGSYFWISKKTGNTFLYYFFGSTEWGKGKMGYYQQNLYRVRVNEDKDPPTVQRIQDDKGTISEIRVQMTKQELAASSACLSER